MATVELARKVFLEQPGAEERSHHGHPDFRVGGKIFATLQPVRKVAVVMLPLADQAGALQMNPEALSLRYWGKKPYLEVDLARANAALLRALARAAWSSIVDARPRARKGHG